MKRLLTAAAFLFVILPSLASAASEAGFAPGSLWLSRTSARAGDAVKVYTVVYNSSSSAIEGDVIFLSDKDEIGGQHFKLGSGETQILSTSWKALIGTHTFSAKLKNVSGVEHAAATVETNAVSIKVEAAPPTAIEQAQNSLTSAISNPTIKGIADTVIDTTEGIRASGADWLNQQLVKDAAALSNTPSGKVLGVEIQNAEAADSGSAKSSAGSIISKVKTAVLKGLYQVFSVRYLFYIALLVVIYILFKIIQGFFRYRRGY